MDIEPITLKMLFEQLGLPAQEPQIDSFIAQHAPLPEEMRVTEAPFWTEAQSELLKSKLLADSDWAGVIDELNVRLHTAPAR